MRSSCVIELCAVGVCACVCACGLKHCICNDSLLQLVKWSRSVFALFMYVTADIPDNELG